MTLRQRVDIIIKATLDKHQGNQVRTAAELACSVRMIRYAQRRMEREALEQATTDEQREFLKKSFQR